MNYMIFFKNKLKDKILNKIPVNYDNQNYITFSQHGHGINFNIKINNNKLNKNILSIRYLNGRKLSNKLLHDDYKISNNIVDATKYNRNIHKLSPMEMKIYYLMQKFSNKNRDVNIFIGSYILDNKSKPLFNKINKILYDKYRNNLISQDEYTNSLSKIYKV